MESSDMKPRPVPACPACGGVRLSPYRKGTFSAADLTPEDFKITDSRYGATWDLSRCLDCGHIFADPCPPPALVNATYGAIEDPLYDAEAAGRGKNFLRILRRLEKLQPGKGRLMDVGAATGILLRLARDRGWTPDGVEPSAWAVGHARRVHGIALREGAFETVPLEPFSCDAVTMVDFIEHTAVPNEALKQAARILKPGGVLCLVTPDIRSLAARLAGRRWWHFRPAHLAYFSRHGLDALFRRTGFAPVLRKRYAWTFSAHYLLSRLNWTRGLLINPRTASFLEKIPIQLALGDSFEIYARRIPSD
jgi:SAM-dependent methyltransferase